MPIVYTPTVGRACQEYSHIIRRTRGLWITPGRRRSASPRSCGNAPYDDVRLIVVTDNERILGLGDQGAGGMAIPIGKLALYTAGAGIHPAPDAADHRSTSGPTTRRCSTIRSTSAGAQPRLRGAGYDALRRGVRRRGVDEVWPGRVVQWEDFKQRNALRLLERYRHRMPVASTTTSRARRPSCSAGLLAGCADLGTPLARRSAS